MYHSLWVYFIASMWTRVGTLSSLSLPHPGCSASAPRTPSHLRSANFSIENHHLPGAIPHYLCICNRKRTPFSPGPSITTSNPYHIPKNHIVARFLATYSPRPQARCTADPPPSGSPQRCSRSCRAVSCDTYSGEHICIV